MYSLISHFHLQTFYQESISEIDTSLIHATCAETSAAEHKDALAHGDTSTAEHKNIPFKRGTQVYQDCSTHRCKGTAVLKMSQCRSTGVCSSTVVHMYVWTQQCTQIYQDSSAQQCTAREMHTDELVHQCTQTIQVQYYRGAHGCCSTEVEMVVLLHTWYQHACVLMPQCMWMYYLPQQCTWVYQYSSTY